jgi:MFS family permease
MDWRNRIGLYGSYFLGMAAIGFTLPYLPLYLGEKGLSDRAIGIVSTLAALSALAQFPVGLWSDRIGWRKPFLVVALAVAALSTLLLRDAHGIIWLGFLVVTDRLADPRRAGEAQVIVGSCLVFGSAIGPAAASVLVGPLGYRGLFLALAGVGAIATLIVVFFVPETLEDPEDILQGRPLEPMATTSDLSVVP